MTCLSCGLLLGDWPGITRVNMDVVPFVVSYEPWHSACWSENHHMQGGRPYAVTCNHSDPCGGGYRRVA